MVFLKRISRLNLFNKQKFKNMKAYFLITVLSLALSFSANAQTEKSNEQENIGNFTYYEPIFVHKSPNKPNKLYERFEEISVIAIDSVINRKKPLYNVKEKYKANLTATDKNELVTLFKSKNKNYTDSDLPHSLKEISTATDNRYGMFFLVETRSSTSHETTPISKVQLETIIFDFKQNAVVFYKKSKNLSPKGNGGYAHTLIKNLKYINRAIRKL